MTQPLWTPKNPENTQLAEFMRKTQELWNAPINDYRTFWKWSVDHKAEFWESCWDFFQIIGDKGTTILIDHGHMKEAKFFPEASLNYAENLLRRRDDGTAIIFRNEKGEDRSLTFRELYEQVSLWQQYFMQAGITKGDRIAGYMPNIPETIIAMLAATSLGAIWSSASPDFGAQGLLDRFGQIEPKIMIGVDGYYYNGKNIDCLEKIKDVQGKIKGLEQTIIVPFINENPDISGFKDTKISSSLLGDFTPKDVQFTRVEFNHPLFIMFSSGTTGAPKCIVHGHGGTLITHLKEFILQCDVRKDDRVFYFTTCGWMMWNWLVSGLAAEAALLLFDGSPFYPDGNALWKYAQDHKCTLFGTSAKYIDALKTEHYEPGRDFDLSSIKTITSTGSPLVHESFDYVYRHIKKDVHLASIYGGTDIISASFGIGNPISPVYRGEIQGPALATDVHIFNENGEKILGQGGELVCTSAFPSMPVMFWNDEDSAKYSKAYFETFDNVWHHGDWVEENPDTHGFIIHGRSDATLNPGGVRIGTAEIYRQVEQVGAVKESVCVGQDWDGDVRVILFVVLKDGFTLGEDLIKEIKTKIRAGASPRHVPAKVLEVSDIPRTKSGKITELAVRDVIMNRPIKNVTALANPKALELYKDLEALKA